MFLVTWPNPYMVKNFENLLLRNQEADDLQTWYTASGTRVLPTSSNDDPGLTLTIFITVSNLFSECSCISKFVLIQHILSTEVSDTGPLVLWLLYRIKSSYVCHA